MAMHSVCNETANYLRPVWAAEIKREMIAIAAKASPAEKAIALARIQGLIRGMRGAGTTGDQP